MPVRTWLRILVPQKTLDRAKTRLRSVLNPEARRELTLRMLRRTLEVCRELQSAGVILSGPAELAELADEFGAELVLAGEAGMRRDIMELQRSAAC